MEYRKFRDIVKGSEKATVDFKIQCDAFASNTKTPNAELAKDICAMANNGNVASYIIIGVSDDRQSFKSVTNKKLTDDALQDFCKRAIFPPPKIKLFRRRWNNGLPDHKGKVFVIIQVGNQPRQTFRLAQDFIDYKEKLCFRRNEAWIRRGATSDLATPEEIARLVSGKPLEDDKESELKRKGRERFLQLSAIEQSKTVNALVEICLSKAGYRKLSERNLLRACPLSFHEGGGYSFQTFWKRLGSTAIIICPEWCQASLTKVALKGLYYSGHFDVHFGERSLLPKSISRLLTQKVKTVRRIWVLPIIKSVPVSRVIEVYPNVRRASGSNLHFYRSNLQDYFSWEVDSPQFIASSSELICVDGIMSSPDFLEEFSRTISSAEEIKGTILSPKRKAIK